MLVKKIISTEELSRFGSVENLNEQLKSVVIQQKETWEIASRNYDALNGVQTRNFDFGHFKIVTQFNPERIRSSSAKTDPKSIAERPCFLCMENLPVEQKGILFQNKYLILTNPYPIFPAHFTISHLEHVPQQILPYFPDLLDLSQNLTDFTVFYNGPKCGASAPDHFHFQAVNNGVIPVEKEFELLERMHTEILFKNKNSKVISVENYLRKFIAIVSPDKKVIIEKFEQIYGFLGAEKDEEPMMNIICNFSEKKWRIIIFPRRKQRPSHFYHNSEKQIIVGPAAVEMGGILVLPRKEDYYKITIKEITEIYQEVTISSEKLNSLISRIQNSGL